MDVEQQRRDRLQTAVDRDTPLTQKNALAFLRTAAGKTAVARVLATTRDKQARQVTESPGKPNVGVSMRTTAYLAVTEADAKEEVRQVFMRQEQASIRHDFNAISPPPLSCPRSDCYATFVDPGHCVRHTADVHPMDDPGITELALVLSNSAGLATFEHHFGVSRTSGGVAASPNRQSTGLSVPKEHNENENVRDILDLWQAMQEWRTVLSSSDCYRSLSESILTEFTKRKHHLPDDVMVALGGEHLRSLGKLGATRRKLTTNLRGHWIRSTSGAVEPSRELPVDPLAMEEASWQLLVALHQAIGQPFLGSVVYRSYIDGLSKPVRDAVAAAAADIADRERAKWMEEARTLRAAALRRKQETDADSLAEDVLTVVFGGAASGGLLEGLVDDQVVHLAYALELVHFFYAAPGGPRFVLLRRPTNKKISFADDGLASNLPFPNHGTVLSGA